MKTVDFSENIKACDLKVGKCRQLIEFIKSLLDLGTRIYIRNSKLAFLRNQLAILNKILYVSF